MDVVLRVPDVASLATIQSSLDTKLPGCSVPVTFVIIVPGISEDRVVLGALDVGVRFRVSIPGISKGRVELVVPDVAVRLLEIGISRLRSTGVPGRGVMVELLILAADGVSEDLEIGVLAAGIRESVELVILGVPIAFLGIDISGLCNTRVCGGEVMVELLVIATDGILKGLGIGVIVAGTRESE